MVSYKMDSTRLEQVMTRVSITSNDETSTVEASLGAPTADEILTLVTRAMLGMGLNAVSIADAMKERGEAMKEAYR